MNKTLFLSMSVIIAVFFIVFWVNGSNRDFVDEKYDTAILFTGDSDFLALVTYIRNGGKKAYIFSSKNNVSQELRTGGDGYFDVLDLEEDIWGRELKYRSNKP